MFFELSIICSIIFALWIIGKLLMLFDIVHVPKKQIHIWRHVKHLNQVNEIPLKKKRGSFELIEFKYNELINRFVLDCTGLLLFNMRDNADFKWFLL